MIFDDLLDAAAVGRIEREHDIDVNREAFEVHVADLAVTRLGDHLHGLGRGSRATVHLLTGDVVRGAMCAAPPEWLALRQPDHGMLVALTAIARLHVDAGPQEVGSEPPAHSLGAVLREHQEVSGSVRLWSRDGTRLHARLRSVCADFVVLEDGALVPIPALAVIELR